MVGQRGSAQLEGPLICRLEYKHACHSAMDVRNPNPLEPLCPKNNGDVEVRWSHLRCLAHAQLMEQEAKDQTQVALCSIHICAASLKKLL